MISLWGFRHNTNVLDSWCCQWKSLVHLLSFHSIVIWSSVKSQLKRSAMIGWGVSRRFFEFLSQQEKGRLSTDAVGVAFHISLCGLFVWWCPNIRKKHLFYTSCCHIFFSSPWLKKCPFYDIFCKLSTPKTSFRSISPPFVVENLRKVGWRHTTSLLYTKKKPQKQQLLQPINQRSHVSLA